MLNNSSLVGYLDLFCKLWPSILLFDLLFSLNYLLILLPPYNINYCME